MSALTIAVAGAAMIAPAASLAAGSVIGTASATPTSASATALDLGALLTLGKSDSSTTGGQSVTVLKVAGINLLSKDSADKNTGTLAAVGGLLDGIDHATCRQGTAANGFCLLLLGSNDASNATSGSGVTTATSNASYDTLALTLSKYHIRVLGSAASSITATVGGAKACQNAALGYLINTDGIIPSTVNGNVENTAIDVKCP
jgi:hypothetical protein